MTDTPVAPPRGEAETPTDTEAIAELRRTIEEQAREINDLRYPGDDPTDTRRVDALEWLVRDANTKRVWIAQGCVCVIGIGREQLIEGNNVRDALDALSALQEDTADVR